MDKLRIASAQLNPTVGDISGNLEKARRARSLAAAEGADLIVFPELFILGYPPEDLVLKPAAVSACLEAIETFAKEDGIATLIGTPWREEGKLYNAVVLIDGGIEAVRFKHDLPNYAVFDEKRVFASGPVPQPVHWRGISLGLPICEDIWLETAPRALAAAGAEFFISINGSPWRRSIEAERNSAFLKWTDLGVPLVFVNEVGGQDELVFDGGSFAWDPDGSEILRLPAFEEAIGYSDWEKTADGWRGSSETKAPLLTGLEADWKAACLALGDYVNKNGFPGVVLGMSGGIDSAISAAMAADALGPDRVWAVMMPSKYTSGHSLEDAKACAEALGVKYDIIDVEPAIEAVGGILANTFKGREPDTTEENIQSRMRGVVLMALSNKFGPMVLSTGNKSEMAVGYATLYGDMNGGYNALKDIYKTEVYELARWRNQQSVSPGLAPAGEVIPERIITKAPSAELRADQTDQDSLPEYDVLDAILTGLVENEQGPRELASQGHDPALIARIENMLYRAEYKRRQAPPGVKIGRKNFGRDRRYPITNKFRSVK
ncbi:NAD+ synthase [Hyphobacterium sp. HN65]|uniref:Glutamine-dependent NAD(+) synthetase n=1 Tax=Hyphobacterium lacteum TaxID=3116575 RepID=A0ABU7LT59_9PROT|nr:NAD+ synthase [Hyphobacterium sp. HN65]MEE2527102.1 NAD+ synthase [Hyphobacterium sp. HN65]